MKPEYLGDGLVMRNASREDMPALLEHFRVIHGLNVVEMLRVLLEHNPRFSWEDSFVIADPNSGEIVSCVILLQNTWSLDGIAFSSVEMEAVGTLESHRYKGHIRMLNDEYEKRAAQHHPVILAIAGIPNFYREFGYDYAAALGGGFPITPALVPKVPEGEKEPVTFKMVTNRNFKEFLRYREGKLPWRTWTRKMQPEDARYLIFDTPSPEHEATFFYLVKKSGQTVGVFFLARWENRLDVLELYLDDCSHVDAVLRFALERAHEWNDISVRVTPPNQAQVREWVCARAQTWVPFRYAWYIKIPSIPRFIETLSPLFSDRLRDTEFQTFTGDLTFTTYKEGYTLSFENGVFKGVTERSERNPREYKLRIPKGPLTRLLMGYETLDELMDHEPDVQCAATWRPLVRLLFPKLGATVDPYY